MSERPPTPRVVGVDIIQDLSSVSKPTEGFLRRHRLRAKSVLENGHRTDVYTVEYVDRAPHLRTAVAVAIYAPRLGAAPEEGMVLLRRQLRYPVLVSTGDALFTEVVAGIIEGEEPLVSATAREVFEESGLEVGESAIQTLGPSFFVTPGAFTERVYPMMVRVDLAELERAPSLPLPGDGSPMEDGAELIVLSLAEALRQITDRQEGSTGIQDAKTEIVLHRLRLQLEAQAR
jgi:8-oxo-dGTP pyrophosphatase MutT (NUDIX family)